MGLSLSFGCMRLLKDYRSLGARRLLFKQGFDSFLKLSSTLIKQSLA
ncbi:sodium:proton antiporter [Helicobacter pylori]|uniref:Sodium:proton antiporter n=1 Tax=Helicobacter pylori TaxID=210 RepID=A0A518YH03_HELPX|nr:sodium:proton antiporter [Helicobacter pylori]